MEEKEKTNDDAAERNEWITVFVPTEQEDDPQDFFPVILGHVFSAIWSLDEEALFVTIEEDGDSEPITSKTKDVKYTVDALGSYFSCANPNCLNTELGKDNKGNERRCPNIFASLLVDSALDMKRVASRLTQKATTRQSQ